MDLYDGHGNITELSQDVNQLKDDIGELKNVVGITEKTKDRMGKWTSRGYF